MVQSQLTLFKIRKLVRKTAPIDYAPELLAQIVQSPTKLNDKI